MPSPLISIITPVYNVEKYLGECIDSIIAQNYPNWELITINDGSTDGSLRILEEYAARDTRIRIINQPNGGYGKAMNAGLDAAQGDYVGIVESDDIIDPSMYEKLLNRIETHQADFVKGGYQYFWDIPNQPRLYKVGAQCPAELSDQPLCPMEHPDCFRIPLYIWAGLYRRSWLEQWNIRVHETPGASYQDTGFWFQTMSFAKRAVWIKDIVHSYRQTNPNSSINKKTNYQTLLNEYSYIENHMKYKAPDIWPELEPLFASDWARGMLFDYHRLSDKVCVKFLRLMRPQMRAYVNAGIIKYPEKINNGKDLFVRALISLPLPTGWVFHFCLKTITKHYFSIRKKLRS